MERKTGFSNCIDKEMLLISKVKSRLSADMIGGWKYASKKRGRIMEMGKSTISLVFSVKVSNITIKSAMPSKHVLYCRNCKMQFTESNSDPLFTICQPKLSPSFQLGLHI